jgi:xanthine dehydrogenase/oxidase
MTWCLAGFCTPGIIVSIYSLYANNATLPQIEEHLDGNLCRCTGYRPIWDAARSLCDGAADQIKGPCGTPCGICPEKDDCEQECNVQAKEMESLCCSSSKDKMALKAELVGRKVDWLNQPTDMFPKELMDDNSIENVELMKPLLVVDRTGQQCGGTWFKPTSLLQLLELLEQYGGPGGDGFKIVVGNTEVGIGKNGLPAFASFV